MNFIHAWQDFEHLCKTTAWWSKSIQNSKTSSNTINNIMNSKPKFKIHLCNNYSESWLMVSLTSQLKWNCLQMFQRFSSRNFKKHFRLLWPTCIVNSFGSIWAITMMVCTSILEDNWSPITSSRRSLSKNSLKIVFSKNWVFVFTTSPVQSLAGQGFQKYDQF